MIDDFTPVFFFWSRCNWKCKRSKQKKRRRTWQRNKRHKPFSLNTRLYYDLNRWSNTENDKWKRKTATLAEKAGHGCLLYLVLWRFVITATPEEQGILEWLLTLWNEFSCRFFFHKTFLYRSFKTTKTNFFRVHILFSWVNIYIH